MIKNLDDFNKPLAPNPCGEDPRYHDDFVFIKQEVEKLSDANFKEVIIKAKNLLLTYTKDMRVLAYFVLAMTAVEGIEGFIESLILLTNLINTFGENLHPQNPALRQSTLNWLNQTRIINLLPLSITTDQFNIINNISKDLNLSLVQKWLSDKKAIEPPILLEEENISIFNFETETLSIIDYLKSKKLLLQAAFYARALRWGNVEYPPHENNVTYIDSPREASHIQLQQAISKDEPEIIYELCENFFLETGGVFWLDLQYYAVMSTNNNIQLSEYLKDSTRSFIQRFPDLIYLYFKDNKPFATEETRQWLLSIIDEKTPEKQKRIGKKIRAKDLNSHLKQLKNQQTQSIKEKFENHYLMAKACMQHKRYDIAYALFQMLEKSIERYHLDEWEPELVLNIWQDFYEVLDIQSKKEQEIRKIELVNHMAQLQIHICQLDVLKGVKL